MRAITVPLLIVWTLILIALAWWPFPPHLPPGLSAPVVAFYTPSIMYPIMTAVTLLMAWFARRDNGRLSRVLYGSMAASWLYMMALR
jgi:hypothetical protein